MAANTGLLTLNTTTGAGTVVQAVGTPLSITALTFDSSGNFFGALTPGAGGTSSLYQISPATGAANLIGGPIGTFGTVGLAFIPVPEPSSLLLLGSALAAGIAFRRLRRT